MTPLNKKRLWLLLLVACAFAIGTYFIDSPVTLAVLIFSAFLGSLVYELCKGRPIDKKRYALMFVAFALLSIPNIFVRYGSALDWLARLLGLAGDALILYIVYPSLKAQNHRFAEKKYLIGIFVVWMLSVIGGLVFGIAAMSLAPVSISVDSRGIPLSSAVLPKDLEPVVVANLAIFAGHTSQSENCKGDGPLGLSDFTYRIDSGDVNDDGSLEYLVAPISECDPPDYTVGLFRGVNGNGPLWVYQKLGGVWRKIADLQGSNDSFENLPLSEGASHFGYRDLSTGVHQSADSAVEFLYQWNPKNMKYELVSMTPISI